MAQAAVHSVFVHGHVHARAAFWAGLVLCNHLVPFLLKELANAIALPFLGRRCCFFCWWCCHGYFAAASAFFLGFGSVAAIAASSS